MIADELTYFLEPERVFSRQDVLTRPSPIPSKPGVYGWCFRRLLPLVVPSRGSQHQDLTLLYVGISPNRPPLNGRRSSRQSLRQRIRYHYTGNAEGSTLRYLLGEELGIQLRRVGSGRRMTFADGEQELPRWMAENAYVSWMVHPAPWELEERLMAELDAPPNLQGNRPNQFHTALTGIRAQCWRRPGLSQSCPTQEWGLVEVNDALRWTGGPSQES